MSNKTEAAKIEYRAKAKQALARAKAELDSGDNARLPYAALELRFSMEALTYDRAQAFKAELPFQEYRTWQPRKVIRAMADIDPKIMKNSQLSVGRDGELADGSPEKMVSLGEEIVLNSADIKGFYEPLGSSLHIPTLAQFESGEIPDDKKLRIRLESTAAIIDRVFTSPFWNNTIGYMVTLKCLRCDDTLRRRIRDEQDSTDVKCFECGAEYMLTSKFDDKANWQAKTQEVNCWDQGCTGTIRMWPDEIRPGTHWLCKTCNKRNGFELCLVRIDNSAE